VLPQQNPAGAPPVLPQQNPANLPPVLPQQNPGNVPPVLPQQNPAGAPPVLPQQNPGSAPPVLPQQIPGNAPPVLPQQNPVSAPLVLPQQNPAAVQQLKQPPASYNSPAFDQISATALGKAMAKALVRTAKKIVYNKSAMQRDKIFKSNNIIHFPFRLQNFIHSTFFRPSKRSESYYRTLSAFAGQKAFHKCFGPINIKYVRHRCLCCC
jgi:hypothetical protein